MALELSNIIVELLSVVIWLAKFATHTVLPRRQHSGATRSCHEWLQLVFIRPMAPNRSAQFQLQDPKMSQLGNSIQTLKSLRKRSLASRVGAHVLPESIKIEQHDTTPFSFPWPIDFGAKIRPWANIYQKDISPKKPTREHIFSSIIDLLNLKIQLLHVTGCLART